MEGKESDEKMMDTELDCSSMPTLILAVHLKRDMDFTCFSLVFPRCWEMYFVDSLTKREDMDLKSFANQTVEDIFNADPVKVCY